MCDCLKAVEEERDFTLKCQETATTSILKFHLDSMLCGYRASLLAIEASQEADNAPVGDPIPDPPEGPAPGPTDPPGGRFDYRVG